MGTRTMRITMRGGMREATFSDLGSGDSLLCIFWRWEMLEYSRGKAWKWQGDTICTMELAWCFVACD